MLRKSETRPVAATGGRAKTVTTVVSGQSHSTTNQTFYNARRQVVGTMKDGWLTKRVDSSRHQLLKPPAWCIDREHLEQLEEIGAFGVLLVDEHGTEWRAMVADFRQYGIPIDRGHGVQVALPLARWRKKVAGQLSLFGEVA